MSKYSVRAGPAIGSDVLESTGKKPIQAQRGTPAHYLYPGHRHDSSRCPLPVIFYVTSPLVLNCRGFTRAVQNPH